MKCSNCGEELNDGTVFCPHCGAKVEAQENVAQEPIPEENEPIVENVVQQESAPIVEEPVAAPVQEPAAAQPVFEQPVQQPIQQNVQQTVQQPVYEQPVAQAAPQAEVKTETKAKDKRPSVFTLVGIVAAVLVVGIIACIALFGSKSPEKIYKGLIKDALSNSIAGEAVTSNTGNIKTGVTISTNMDDFEDELDGINADVNLQYDRAKKQAVIFANVTKGTSKYLNLKAMADLTEKYAVIGEDNLYNKLVKVDLPEEVDEYLENYLGKDYTFEVDAKNQKTIANKIYAAIEKYTKKEWFTKETLTTEIDGKNKKVTDNCLKITGPELAELMKNVVTDLRMDNGYLNCFRNRDTVVSSLDQVEDMAENLDDEDMIYTVHLYTAGNKFMGLAMVQRDDYYGDEDIIEIVKKSDKQYEIDIEQNYYGEVEVVETILIDINKDSKKDKDYTITLKNEYDEEMKVNITLSQEYGKNIELLDASSAVKYEDLSEDDLEELYENLQDSDLYDLIEPVLGTSVSTGDGRSLPKGVTVGANQNYVMSYDDDVVIFNVPNSLENSYTGRSFISYNKEDRNGGYASIDVTISYDDIESYEDELEDYLERIQNDDYYKDAKLTDPETIKVGDRTFYMRELTYKYSDLDGEVRHYKHYYTKINDDYIYTVEIKDEDDQLVTNSEIEKLLTIDVVLADD